MTTVPLKTVVRINQRTLPESTDPSFEFRYVDIGGVGSGALTGEPAVLNFGDSPSRARRQVRRGDTIVSTVRTYLRAVWPVDENATDIVVSTGFAVLTPCDGLYPGYLGWYAQSVPFIEEIVARSTGVSYPAINPAEIGNLRIPVPPLSEQRSIADYLDAEIARIDTLIEKKKRMVELLEERLRLKAYQLTTSEGDEMALRYAVDQVKTGTTPASEVLISGVDGSVPWYSPGDVGAWLSLEAAARTLPATTVIERQAPAFPPRSALVVGIGATAGRVAHLDHEASGNQQMTCITPGPTLDSRFLAWQLFARSDEFRSTAPFTTLPILNNDFIKAIVLRVPQASRQKMIATQLDEDARRTQSLVGCIERQLAKFREHREALITAAITGELSIPGVAA